MCEFIHKIIGNYLASRCDIPVDIKETVKNDAIDAYIKMAEENPEEFAHKTLVEIIGDIMLKIQKKYPDTITSSANSSPGAAGGSRRRHRRSTRTFKKGKKYSTTRRRK